MPQQMTFLLGKSAKSDLKTDGHALHQKKTKGSCPN